MELIPKIKETQAPNIEKRLMDMLEDFFLINGEYPVKILLTVNEYKEFVDRAIQMCPYINKTPKTYPYRFKDIPVYIIAEPGEVEKLWA